MKREWALLGAAFAVLAVVAAVWLAIDRRPPEWDHANHLERAHACARELAGGDLDAVLARSSFYPPLVPCLAGVVARWLPSDIAAAQAVVLAFLAAGMAAIYLIGRARIGGRAGVLAAVLFGAAPFVVFNTVRFQLDLPLASAVAVALWMLLRTDGFTRRGASLAFGVVVGLGLLIKPPFPLYVAPGIVWALSGRAGGGRVRNALLATFAALAVSLAWYGPRVMGMPAQIGARSFRQAAESGHPDPLSWSALAIYPVTLPMFFGAAASVLLVVGLVVAVRRRRWLELASVLVPFVMFLAIQNKNARYTLPILPMAALVAALGVEALRPRVRTAALALTVLVCAGQVSATAFARPAHVAVPGTRVALAMTAPPRRESWRHDEVLAAIGRHAADRSDVATVSVVPNHPWFSPATFRHHAVRDARALRVVRAWDDVPVGVDYMVLKNGDLGPSWTAGKSRRAMARLDDAAFARAFPVIAELPLPDGSMASVRARDLGGGADAAPAAVAAALVRAVRDSLADVARDVEGLDVRVAHDGAIVRGAVTRLEIVARRATVGELRKRGASTLTVGDLHLVVDDLLVNPWTVLTHGRFEPLDARRVRLTRATIAAGDLQRFLAATRGFERTSVRLEPDALAFAIGLPGPDVSGRVRVVPAPGRPFTLDPDGVRLGGVPVPGPLVSWVFRSFDPSARLGDRLPVPVELAGVRVTADAIHIADR
ncbi:MAG: glycosyltransferase family 39 protein [Candidatus Rokubacteria bacterium]|nr:glycosyltransferase family 39 protein [Candidatus Rokubacteria bacterium]